MFTCISCIVRSSYYRTQYYKTLLYSSQSRPNSEKNGGKVVNVAIIGAPNSGKSTLINKIVGRKVCAVSNKVHTTTKLIRAMCYENETQIIFLDTPGVVTNKEKKKYNLPESIIEACFKSLRCADVIGVVHDVSNRYTKDSLNSDLLNMLTMVEHTPSFLILNKVDKLKSKKQLLTIIRNLTDGYMAGKTLPGLDRNKDERKKVASGYPHFSDVFLISALEGDGVVDIKQYLVNNAKYAGLQYASTKWTDQAAESLIEDAVRAKFLDFLDQEIPYNLRTELEYFEERQDEDKIVCSVAVECPSDRLVRLISGAGGGRLQQIKSQTRNDLIALFKKPVVIDIRLKTKHKPVAN